MRFFMGLVLALALGVMGCSEAAGTGGTGGDGGTGGMTGQEFPCTESGIRAAIAEGGGPFTFDCDGPQTVVTEAEIVIDNDVILDGEGNLTVDGDDDHLVFRVEDEDATDPGQLVVGLRGLTVTGGAIFGDSGGGIRNGGTLTLTDCTISENRADAGGGGIFNFGSLTVRSSTISGNIADYAGAILISSGGVSIWNSTVSGNTTLSDSGAIWTTRTLDDDGSLSMSASTVSGNIGGGIKAGGSTYLRNTIVKDDCDVEVPSVIPSVVSAGNNIESPGDTCGFDQPTDQVNVSADDLNLEEFADNGGPTMTQALGAGSVAIDQIPAEDCVDADGAPLTTDQRGEPRPGGTACDVGAFEVQP